MPPEDLIPPPLLKDPEDLDLLPLLRKDPEGLLVPRDLFTLGLLKVPLERELLLRELKFVFGLLLFRFVLRLTEVFRLFCDKFDLRTFERLLSSERV